MRLKKINLFVVLLLCFGITSLNGFAQNGTVSVLVVEHLELTVDDNDLTFQYDYLDIFNYMGDGPIDRNTISVTANCNWQLKITADADYFTGPNGQSSSISVEGLTIQDPLGSPYDNSGDIRDLLTRTGHKINESGGTFESSFDLTWRFNFGTEPDEIGNIPSGDYLLNTTYTLTSLTSLLVPSL